MDWANLKLRDLITLFEDGQCTPSILLSRIAINGVVIMAEEPSEDEKVKFSAECLKYDIGVQFPFPDHQAIIRLIPRWLNRNNTPLELFCDDYSDPNT